ncbi:hypothetical protein [Fulvivirga sp. M361]|nr:hypothetical protein [Fulvivirga sp. M361]
MILSTHLTFHGLNALNEGQREALVIYLLGQATYVGRGHRAEGHRE